MKTKEDIKKEYNEYQLESKVITSKEETYYYIEIQLLNIIEELKVLKFEKKYNNRNILKNTILNYFDFIFKYVDKSLYNDDNEVVTEIISYITEVYAYLETIKKLTNDENYQETARLTEFVVYNYNETLDYYELARDRVEYFHRGIVYSICAEDNKLAFKEFLEAEISTLQNKKSVEKVKKIC